jgi:oligopeptide transport system permease protein
VSFKLQKNRPVLAIILELFPVSAKLGAAALMAATCAGVAAGEASASVHGRPADSARRVLMTLGISVPGFVIATTMMALLGVRFRLLPTMGLEGLAGYVMPVAALSIYPACHIGRITRSAMLDALGADYIRTATAMGLGRPRILFKHALRNALVPVLTYLGPMAASVLTGGFVVESVFSIPGLGRYFVISITNRDYPLVLGTTVFLSAIIVAMSLLVDLAYKAVDPRIGL